MTEIFIDQLFNNRLRVEAIDGRRIVLRCDDCGHKTIAAAEALASGANIKCTGCQQSPQRDRPKHFVKRREKSA